MGRETALQKVVWDDDGWLRLSDPVGAYEQGETFKREEAVYQFNGQDLHPDFQWLRVPNTNELFSLEERPEALRLYGRDSLGSLYASSLVARRQQHFNFEVTTRLEFNPYSFQQMAGLVLYYNAHKFHYLYVTYDEELGRTLQIMSCLADETLHAEFPLAEAPIPLRSEGAVHLKASVEGASLQFGWSVDGSDWQDVGEVLDASLLSDEVGKGEGANFTGTFVGMACQDITGDRLPADFFEFQYKEH